ncbi:hypothetical protein [Streptomyces sp. KHY 26]|uniref:hypothetical protein n=1 Tax=Streptomyces sp. KHY 26 TaxID=3097359 RepID=UPI00376F1EF2
MARILRMPTEDELPPGPRRKFVEELFFYYRAAGRPALRLITDDVATTVDVCTASRETVRRMLRGQTVPVNWQVVDAVLTVLCARAGIDPEEERWEGGFTQGPSHRANLREAWNEALDTPATSPAPQSGWGYPDEPPF